MPSKTRVTVNLSDQEYEELTALSNRHRVSLAWLGRQSIIEFLERCRTQPVQLPRNFEGHRKETTNL